MDFREEHLTAIIETRNNVANLKEDMEKFMQDQREASLARDKACASCFEDHEKRIRNLESFYLKLAGGLTVLGLGASAFFARIFGGS